MGNMKTEKCTICGEIVYVKDNDSGQEEWVPGAICCTKLSAYFCAAHKPCCAETLAEAVCAGMEGDDDEEDFDDDDEDYDDEDYADVDPDTEMEETNG